ncbi:hypothetical protein OUZ56_011193 [Daphnia magna]|uniref:Uncharacterized protein n=1 Tax=Daphnia magna TaxID=35525 RepID=A0ABQ9YZY3_9CRUS|nr:hypothetical protein OUZ56_011193 [Daphnia magna]
MFIILQKLRSLDTYDDWLQALLLGKDTPSKTTLYETGPQTPAVSSRGQVRASSIPVPILREFPYDESHAVWNAAVLQDTWQRKKTTQRA